MAAIREQDYVDLQARVAEAAASVMTPAELARFTIRMRPSEDCLVASEAGPVRMFYVIEDEDADTLTLRLEDILIEETCRGRGIGTALIRAVSEFSLERGLGLNLSANPLEEFGDPARPAALERLMQFYERLGFENETGLRNGDFIIRVEAPSPSPD